MEIKVKYSDSEYGVLDKLPNLCPFCGFSIIPPVIAADDTGDMGRVVFLCTNDECNELFIGYYSINAMLDNHTRYCCLERIMVGNTFEKTFHQSIQETSPNFVEIYNQAYSAEQYKLTQICGTGYRKSLEFLIKDFSIKIHEEKATEIAKLPLMQVITNYIDDKKIKEVSKRATWLGNDETHYERKWIEKDLTDLKNLIDLTLVFIQADYDYQALITSMPDIKQNGKI